MLSSFLESAFNFSNFVLREGASGKELDESILIDGIDELVMFWLFLGGGVFGICGCVSIDFVGDKLRSELCLRSSLGCKKL